MRIAIIGSDGQLGFDLMRAFGREACIGLTHKDIEVADAASVERALKEVKPEVVINTAAITKTELCEKEPGEAFRVNAVGAFRVAKAASELNAAVVFISTDYVFDGAKPGFAEDDVPSPLNVYGASKLAGEHLTEIANPKHYIVRSSWLFGKNVSHKGYNFVTLMLKLAKEKGEARVVNDQWGSPTYTLDLAAKIKELLGSPVPFGTYHITNQGMTSWFGFAQKIFELVGLQPRLIPISTEESGSAIRRPRSSILENKALKGIGISLLRPWHEALGAYLDEIS